MCAHSNSVLNISHEAVPFGIPHWNQFVRQYVANLILSSSTHPPDLMSAVYYYEIHYTEKCAHFRLWAVGE